MRILTNKYITLCISNEYESYLVVDFAKAADNVKQLFNDISNLDMLFTQLQLSYHASLKPGKSVIIFDEIQKQPLARQAIKYLVADGRYDYIETGSLLSIKKNTKGIVIPSEETVRYDARVTSAQHIMHSVA